MVCYKLQLNHKLTCTFDFLASLAALVYQHSITPLALPCKLLLPESDGVDVPDSAAPVSSAQLLAHGAGKAKAIASYGSFWLFASKSSVISSYGWTVLMNFQLSELLFSSSLKPGIIK